MAKIGIISGSGLDDPKIFKSSKYIEIKTPFGETSSTIKECQIKDEKVFIIARHGRDHLITPSNVNYRANIWALKEIGCQFILASTAVGSLIEEIKPGDIVLPNQFIDFTKKRESTFFDNGEVIHTPMADPFSNDMINIIGTVAESLKIRFHKNKTVITIEGPRFSTKSESLMFRSWGADIINMSSCPEVALAKELGLHYASIAMATDYDCWKEDEEEVTWELIQKIMKENANNVLSIFEKVVPLLRNITI
jgi:5'-methylthioadenosine phosphorylase